jgi:acylphosphatase
MKHLNIIITGRVQGVFFRANTEEKANELGITGYVKNEPDGSVFIEAHGPDENMETFLAWCRKGDRPAVVENIEVSEANAQLYHDFTVRY